MSEFKGISGQIAVSYLHDPQMAGIQNKTRKGIVEVIKYVEKPVEKVVIKEVPVEKVVIK